MDTPFRFLKCTGKRALILFLATVLILVIAVDVTLAILMTKTDPSENTFAPSIMRLSIENIDDIVNNGDVPAYVRAIAVASWYSLDDEHTISSERPEVGEDFEIDFKEEGWFLADDGFSYYTKMLMPGERVELVNHAYQLKEKEGFELRLMLLSTSIQAYPTDAIAVAWPAVSVTEAEDGTPILVPADDTVKEDT